MVSQKWGLRKMCSMCIGHRREVHLSANRRRAGVLGLAPTEVGTADGGEGAGRNVEDSDVVLIKRCEV